MRARRELWLFFAASLAFRALLLALDSQPRFFFNDSQDYLLTRYPAPLPLDRSWAYGLAINAIIDATRSFTGVLIVQSALSAAMCAGLAAFCRWAGVRSALAWAALAFASVDPLLLFHDRSVMTDAPATVAIFAAITLSIVAVHRASIAWALGAVASFWCATLLRTALSPVVTAVPPVLLLVVIVRLRGRDAWPLLRGTGVAALIVAAALGGQASQARIIGALGHIPPTLNARSGGFLLGAVSPILTPEDFRDTGIVDAGRILKESHHENRDLRNAQVFLPFGIVPQLQAEFGGDWRAVERFGSRVAIRAVLRDPLGFAGVAIANAGDYLSPVAGRRYFPQVFGLDGNLDPRVIEMLRLRMVRDELAPDMARRPSLLLGVMPVTVWTTPLLVTIAIALPLALIIAARRLRWRTAESALAVPVLAAALSIYLATIFALGLEPTARYVLPAMPFVLALIAITAESMLRRPAHLPLPPLSG